MKGDDVSAEFDGDGETGPEEKGGEGEGALSDR